MKTNYSEGRAVFPLCKGEEKKGWELMIQEPQETIKEFYLRLAGYGYETISFYEVRTRTRGYHNLIAYVKDRRMQG